MEKRNIQIDLNTAKRWYLSRDSFKQELVLQVFSKEELEEHKLPKSWDEYVNNTPTTQYCDELNKSYKAISKLQELLILRNIYRQGWKPDWTIPIQDKYVVIFNVNKFNVELYGTSVHLFSFPTRKLAEQFLENFKDELKKLKELL